MVAEGKQLVQQLTQYLREQFIPWPIITIIEKLHKVYLTCLTM